VLTQAKKMGRERISSNEISAYTNINASQIRRDLSGFGKFGRRGVGYSVDHLLGVLGAVLFTQREHEIALVGAGRPGQAIAARRSSPSTGSRSPPSSTETRPRSGAGSAESR
jgi:redox-sensing transcriptional repressor